jgi:hypothetical protein
MEVSSDSHALAIFIQGKQLLVYYNVKDKGKFLLNAETEHHTMKAFWWSGSIAPRIL